MTRIIVLDSGPLGLLTAPPNKGQAADCAQWLVAMLTAGLRVAVPEIAELQSCKPTPPQTRDAIDPDPERMD